MVAIPLKHEIPGQNKVIPGSLDKLSKLVISLDCLGQPWTVGNYGGVNQGVMLHTYIVVVGIEYYYVDLINFLICLPQAGF